MSGFQTIGHLAFGQYSVAPKTGRPVWHINVSGFRTSGFRTSGSIQLYPVFRRYLKTGYNVRFSDVCTNYMSENRTVYPVFRHSKPVPNRFLYEPDVRKPEVDWTGGPKNQTLYPVFRQSSEIRSVWEPDVIQKRRKPDVRFSDVYCKFNFFEHYLPFVHDLNAGVNQTESSRSSNSSWTMNNTGLVWDRGMFLRHFV